MAARMLPGQRLGVHDTYQLAELLVLTGSGGVLGPIRCPAPVVGIWSVCIVAVSARYVSRETSTRVVGDDNMRYVHRPGMDKLDHLTASCGSFRG